MDFFDKLSKTASKTYKGAAEKTGKIAKEAKLKMKISENKSKIEDIYQEIGKKVYQKHASKEELDIQSFLDEQCTKIDELSNEIEKANKEILDLANVKICVNEKCKETIAKEAKFCPKCGAEQPVEQETEVIETEVVENKDEVKNEEKSESGNCENNQEKSENSENNREKSEENENENNSEETKREENVDNN